MAITLPALIRTRLTTFAAKTTSFAKSLDFKKFYGTLKLESSTIIVKEGIENEEKFVAYSASWMVCTSMGGYDDSP